MNSNRSIEHLKINLQHLRDELRWERDRYNDLADNLEKSQSRISELGIEIADVTDTIKFLEERSSLTV